MPVSAQTHKPQSADDAKDAPSRSAGASRPGAASLPVACSVDGACPGVVHRKAAKGRGGYFGGASPSPGDASRGETSRRESGGGEVAPAAGAAVRKAVAGGGEPLDPGTRGFFEGRFGRGLGDVRVHTGAQADASARGVDALAYTVGRDVVFRSGSYAPGTAAGSRLLAHELAHTVQQGGGRPPPTTPLRVAPADGPGERDADAAAEGALSRGRSAAPSLRVATGTLQRQTPTGNPPAPAGSMGSMTGTPVAATPQQMATTAADFLREMARFTAERRARALEMFRDATPIPIHTGYSQQVRAQQSISQTSLRQQLEGARRTYQTNADALPGGDPLRATLRDAYITALHEIRVTMRASIGLSQQLLHCATNPSTGVRASCPREAEPPLYVENLALWIEASPMTSASLAGTTSFAAADQAAATRWEEELRAYYLDVAETLPALAATPPAPAGGGTPEAPAVTAAQASGAAARILAGVRRSSLTVGTGAAGTTGVRDITDAPTIAGRRAMETAIQPLVQGAQPMRLITVSPPAYTLPTPIPTVTPAQLAASGIPDADTRNVPAAEVDAVRFGILQAGQTVFDAASTDVRRNAFWPIVIPVPRGGATVMVRYELVFASDGAVRAERLGDAAPREVSPAFAGMTVAQKKAQLVTDFGLTGVDDHTATWTSGELDQLQAALALMQGTSRAAVRGVAFVRDHTGAPMSGGFTPAGYAHTGADPTADTTPPALAHGPPHIHIYDNAFTGTGLTFSGDPGSTGPGVDRVIAHEVGHMVFGQRTLAANTAMRAALAALNTLVTTTPMAPGPLAAFNAWGPAQSAANAAIVAYVGSQGGATSGALRATAAAAVATRNTARAAMAPAGVPATLVAAATALDTANDALMTSGDNVPTFATLAGRFGFHRFTDYAARQGDSEWFAETHALFITDPNRLFSMNRRMFAWFQAGMPNDPTWNP